MKKAISFILRVMAIVAGFAALGSANDSNGIGVMIGNFLVFGLVSLILFGFAEVVDDENGKKTKKGEMNVRQSDAVLDASDKDD